MNEAFQSLPKFRVLLLLAAFFTAACAVAGEPTLKEAGVIKLSNAAAQKKGYRLADYGPPKAHYEYVHKDGSWSVFYEGKRRLPGNHFIVVIQDKTQKVELMPGE